MEARMPRVLMVHGYPLHEKDNATSQTLQSLFAHWNPDHLAQIICRHAPVSGPQIYHLASTDVVGIDLYHKIRRPKARGIQFAVPVPGAVDLDPGNLKRMIREFAVTYSELLPYRISDDLNEFIVKFRPDVIYTLLGNYRITKLVSDLAKIHHLPVVPHFMDDWMSTRFAGRLIFRPVRACILHALTDLMADVREGLTISAAMAEEYRRVFNIPMKPLMNCVDIPLGGFPESAPEEARRIITYAGGLHLYRWESALAIAQAVELIRSGGRSIEFHIYTSVGNRDQFESRFSGYNGTKFFPFVAPGDLKKIYRHSFLLVHLESFNPIASQYTRLSISTKIPEYMVAARPILAIGPRGIASIEHILATASGTWATADADRIVDIILGLMSSNHQYTKFCLNAFRAAMEHHSSQSQQAVLSSVLVGAAPLRS